MTSFDLLQTSRSPPFRFLIQILGAHIGAALAFIRARRQTSSSVERRRPSTRPPRRTRMRMIFLPESMRAEVRDDGPDIAEFLKGQAAIRSISLCARKCTIYSRGAPETSASKGSGFRSQ
jgi:hypothetical protein